MNRAELGRNRLLGNRSVLFSVLSDSERSKFLLVPETYRGCVSEAAQLLAPPDLLLILPSYREKFISTLV
jgi:hypothetical protein